MVSAVAWIYYKLNATGVKYPILCSNNPGVPAFLQSELVGLTTLVYLLYDWNVPIQWQVFPASRQLDYTWWSLYEPPMNTIQCSGH